MPSINVKKLNTLTGHKDCLYTLAPYDNQRFFSSGADGMIVLWDLQDPEHGQMVGQVPSSVYALSYNAERQLLIVGQNNDGIHLIDVSKKQEVRSVSLTKSAIFDLKSDADNIWVATGDGTVLRLDWELRVVARAQYTDKSARTMAVHPERMEIAVGYSDNHIRIIHPQTLKLIKVIRAHDISVFTTIYHHTAPVLISGSRDARIKIWDAEHDFVLKEEILAHMYAINHIDFSPNGHYFVSCSMDKSIKVWDAHNYKLLKVIDKARHAGHATSVNKILWMPYNNWLVSCSDDRTISVWDINFAG